MNLKQYKIKIGSFLYYREIEDKKRRDQQEGQRGLDLILKRPCKKLDELIKKNGYGDYNSDYLDSTGCFKGEYHLLVHDHMYEFNAWVFCCSIIDDLNDIEKLKTNFECDSFYFISDIDKFINSIQRSLGKDLISTPKTLSGELRVKHPEKESVFLDGWKDIVSYKNDSKSMTFTYDTLEDFLNNKDSRSINQKLWFQKPVKFRDEMEFRYILYPSGPRPENKRYSINEKYCFLDVDLTGCISENPAEI